MLRQILNSKAMARGGRTPHAACSLCKQGRGGRTILELQLSQNHRLGSAMGKNSRDSPSSTSAPSEIMVLRPSVAALEVLAVVECLPVPGLTTPAFDNGSSPATVSMWEARRSVVNWVLGVVGIVQGRLIPVNLACACPDGAHVSRHFRRPIATTGLTAPGICVVFWLGSRDSEVEEHGKSCPASPAFEVFCREDHYSGGGP